ncbi:hypothetical protein DP939_25790 [Spongiactinospora rosea]|uniref:Peptidase S9A N-terminal domain-containing protein n=1 Tax=Spongiactinospora rosea TaxID=2248750 RepID=A0A366LTT5_9ACTN|nr:hypothetical protein DP939_25790 [Spongiactinospora rosea]
MAGERARHGDVVVAEYAWLISKDDPGAVARLEAENAYTEQVTGHLDRPRETIFQEIENRTQETDLPVLTRKRGWWYYSRTVEGRQYGIKCRVGPSANSASRTPVVASGPNAVKTPPSRLSATVAVVPRGPARQAIRTAWRTSEGSRLATVRKPTPSILSLRANHLGRAGSPSPSIGSSPSPSPAPSRGAVARGERAMLAVNLFKLRFPGQRR